MSRASGVCGCGCGESMELLDPKGRPRAYLWGHCNRGRRIMRPPRALLDRVHENIAPEPNTGCWLWTGTIATHGYGVMSTGGHRGTGRAHVVAYRLMIGTVPSGLVLDHRCRVKRCVNPAHLEPVTQAENLRRARHA